MSVTLFILYPQLFFRIVLFQFHKHIIYTLQPLYPYSSFNCDHPVIMQLFAYYLSLLERTTEQGYLKTLKKRRGL